MIQDLHDFPDNSDIDTDLCIVGGGIAGISIASGFLNQGINVCLLESGGSDYEGNTQALYEGENLGLPYYDLEDARLRFFGGTTLVWGGRCVPHDAIDFENRPWVPHSGWPISRTDLDSWYIRAQESLELKEPIYDEQAWKKLGITPPQFDPHRIRTGFWQFDEAFARFSLNNCKDLKQADNIRILLHANVTNIQVDPLCKTIQHVDIATLEGKKGRLCAKAFVLATGGIETPRLLLASRGVASNGIGNDNDLVGLFFMEHPHGRAAHISTPDPYQLWNTFRKRRARGGNLFAPVIRSSEQQQKSSGILNTSVTLKCQRKPEAGIPIGKAIYKSGKARLHPTKGGRKLWRFYKKTNQFIHTLTDPIIRRRQLSSGRGGLYLIVRGEQAPNVHGIDNLYVAGSSLFPTSGWANPVLTTLALTLRLADHLKPRLS